jgi:hypothetical protein
MTRTRRVRVATISDSSEAAWWLAASLVAAVAVAATCALAQPAPPPAATPDPPQPGIGAPGSGVITPTPIDPSIQVRPPVPANHLPTPVIPPPGTAGGHPLIVPK